jgi:hypothetical protein
VSDRALPGQESIAAIRVVSPAWDTFTNADGTGLYFDLLRAVFQDLYGIEVEHQFVPSLRATHLVRENEADMMVCKARVDPPLSMARIPMYENAYAVFYDSGNVGPWQGRESMTGRSVVWRIGYYDQRYIPEGMQTKEVKTGTSALGMVILGRADFYLDDPVLIRESIARTDLTFDRERFRIEPVGFRSYHPVLLPTARGGPSWTSTTRVCSGCTTRARWAPSTPNGATRSRISPNTAESAPLRADKRATLC